mmetsp:Transcript_11135/g.11231  ORF Transcript_11135/g.11231 Transcript_11135/m.11231 type:complete len:146 (+) Transcript_11135:3-440(+)
MLDKSHDLHSFSFNNRSNDGYTGYPYDNMQSPFPTTHGMVPSRLVCPPSSDAFRTYDANSQLYYGGEQRVNHLQQNQQFFPHEGQPQGQHDSRGWYNHLHHKKESRLYQNHHYYHNSAIYPPQQSYYAQSQEHGDQKVEDVQSNI